MKKNRNVPCGWLTFMKNCLNDEELSAFVDSEGGLAEGIRVRIHLSHCPRCRATLRLMIRMREELRSRPVPPMPEDLREALERMIPEPAPPAAHGAWRLSGIPIRRPAPGGMMRQARRERLCFLPAALGLSLAGALIIVAWLRQGASESEIPLELVLAAHHRYSRRLPFAEPERVLALLSNRVDAGDDFGGSP